MRICVALLAHICAFAQPSTLEKSCISCHPTFTSRQALISAKLIVPGKADDSPLYKVLLLPPGTPHAMPPAGALPNREIRGMKSWIDAGAEWVDKPATVSHDDERQTVEKIREKILARARPSEMKPYEITIPNTTVSYRMVPVAAGTFEMGSDDEPPRHKVHLDAFWMQAHEVTWDEYRLFMFAAQSDDAAVDAVSRPTRPYVEMSFGMGINGYPAISMTQHAANKYAEWLSARTGEFYRLPTEAEWEYACRAGVNNAVPLDDYAWSSKNSRGTYQKVATKKPNPWGLFDMLGNVMEWTLDQYAPYSANEQTNPWVQSKTAYPQSVRGGSWHDDPAACRCSARVASDPSWKRQDPQLPKSIWYHTDAQWLGFRLVRPVKIPLADEMYKYWNNGVARD